MDIYEYGSSQAPVVLIQMVGEHDLPGIEREIMEIRRLTDMEFQLIAVKVNNWNQDLSPWNAAAVFGKEEFGNGAKNTLEVIEKLCADMLLIANPTDYSFPSGHTLSSVIGATILTKTDRRFGYAAIPLAALIAFSRLYLYVHFPSDVLAAAVLGVLIGKVSDRVGMHLINWMEQVWKERTVH